MSKTILLIDGDVIAYRAAAAAETRSVEVIHKSSGRSKIFKTRTAFKTFLSEKNFTYVPEDYEFVDIQSEEDVSHPLHTVKLQINAMVRDTQADAYELFIGGADNFRETLPLPSKYKGNRADMLRPVHLDACKNYCVGKMGADIIEGHESDDALIYRGYWHLEQGHKVIMATIDKDSWAYSGLHLYNFTKPEDGIILIPDPGNLFLNAKDEVKGWGFMWFCHQMLIGDTTDNYKPTEIAKIKFGEKSSYKVLKDCKTKQEAWNVVVQHYKKWYPKQFEYTCWDGDIYKADWEWMLQLYFRCARMMQTSNDSLDIRDFMEKEKIKYVG